METSRFLSQAPQGQLLLTGVCGSCSCGKKIMEIPEDKIDELLYALDAALYAPPSEDLELLISLIAKKVDEYELEQMMLG